MSSFFGDLPLTKRRKPITPPQPPSSNKKFVEELPPEDFAHSVPSASQSSSTQIGESSATLDADTATYDVIHIDSVVKRELRGEVSKIPSLEKKLKITKWILKNSNDPTERNKAKVQLRQLREEIRDIESGATLADYIYSTSSIIEQYTKMKPEKQTFLYTEPQDVTILQKNKKNELKLQYLCIARNYIQLSSFRQNSRRLMCSNQIAEEGNEKSGRLTMCGSTDFYYSEDNVYVCMKCSCVTELQSDSPTFKDTERINMSARYVYTRKGHFNDAMNKFEGKQNTNIDASVYHDINESIRLHNLSHRTVTKEQIYMFLSETGNSKRYEDINLIASVVTKNRLKPPDISKYRKNLLLRFDELESAYSVTKDPTRVNSMSVNFKLYKLLQLEGFPCKKDDFFILKTQAKTDEHEDAWMRLMEYLSKKDGKRWRYIETE